ncbi:MAG TPA: hypothetical protein VGP82_19015 [Ktedonobacterales bacterium]|jgi:hypothetical protein|nr:hypothetical protein [Ktedonobacterales bacterium]
MPRPVLVRLVLSLLLGLLVGSYTDITLSTATPIDAAISAAVLAVPPLLAVQLDPELRRSGKAQVLVAVGFGLVLVVFPILDVLFNAGQGFPGLDLTTIIAVDLLIAPLVAAFSLGTRGKRLGSTAGLAIGCGVLAWVGVGLHHILLPYPTGLCRSLNGATEFADLACIVRDIVWVVGVGVAVVSSLIGATLRIALTRRLV